MEYLVLPKVNSPGDLKKLSMREMDRYALEVRSVITQSVLKNGGHLASSLGAVELMMALHYVYLAPNDKIIFDVGHQSYAHKIITGRRDKFDKLRCDGGLSGFPKPKESVYDTVTCGHASTSLSSALGLCRARDLKNEKHQVVAVIGDGALTGGMAFEALNDIGAAGTDLTIVLNDNEMSISKNVGAMSRYFSKLRISKSYLNFKSLIKKAVSALPFFGDKLVKFMEKGKNALTSVFKTNKMFEQMGIRYYGPYDGNDLHTLIEVFNQVKDLNGPVLVHILTKKGCGFADAEKNPAAFHGLPPAGGSGGKSFGYVAGEHLCSLAAVDERICAVTAAMADGTGMSCFYENFPKRYFDVGIAEQHAVTMAAGLSAGGFRPFVAIYSTFLQRAYDQILHDVAIDNLPVTFLIDRAGANEGDGETHQGVFDIAFLSSIPNLTVLAPKDGEELKKMMSFSLTLNAPVAIRYPKKYDAEYSDAEEKDGKLYNPLNYEFISSPKAAKVCVLAAGNRMLDIASKLKGAAVVNARCLKPLCKDFLSGLKGKFGTLITLEDGIINGGFGSAVRAFYDENDGTIRVITKGFKDSFINTHSVETAFKDNGLTVEALQKIIDGV